MIKDYAESLTIADRERYEAQALAERYREALEFITDRPLAALHEICVEKARQALAAAKEQKETEG